MTKRVKQNQSYEKLLAENTFLREAHNRDQKAIADLKAASVGVGLVADMVIGEIVRTYGEAVESDGELIGYAFDISLPKPKGGKLIISRHDKYIGLDKREGYRIGWMIEE